MKSIEGKLVLITGGASGIGKLVAFRLASRGARVVAWDIDGKALEVLEAEAAATKLAVAGMRCDVSDRREVYRQAAKLKELYGDVEILVNNAGIVSGTKFLETPDEKIERTVAVNVMSSFWTVKAFLPGMIERGSGHVVTMSSAGGIIGVAGLADYSASQFAAFGFSEALRMELRKARSPVQTTVVCPYFINSDLFAGVKTKFPFFLPLLKPEKVADRIVRAVRKGKKRLIMPAFVHSFLILRPFPVGFHDAIAEFFGISSCMDEFKGRGNG